MKDKRGQGISMEFIIIAAIALIVLIVIVLFFTGGLAKIFGGQKDVVGTVTDQQKEIWRSQCSVYCGLEDDKRQSSFFCKHLFQVKNEKGEVVENWACSTTLCSGLTGSPSPQNLEVTCPQVTKTP